MAKQKIIGIQTLSKELRLEMIRFGMTVIEDLAEEIAKVANANAPVAQGTPHPDMPLRRGPDKSGGGIKGSIFAQQSQKVPNSWLVVSPKWYSHFPEYGTREHDIASKRGKTMMFPAASSKSAKKGKVVRGIVMTKSVNHPGVRGKGKKAFLRPAADQAEIILKRILSQIDKG